MNLTELEVKLGFGDLQIAYNADLNLQVLIDGDGETYKVYFIQDNKIVKIAEMSFTERGKVPYYCAEDIAAQYSDLPSALLLKNKH